MNAKATQMSEICRLKTEISLLCHPTSDYNNDKCLLLDFEKVRSLKVSLTYGLSPLTRNPVNFLHWMKSLSPQLLILHAYVWSTRPYPLFSSFWVSLALISLFLYNCLFHMYIKFLSCSTAWTYFLTQPFTIWKILYK